MTDAVLSCDEVFDFFSSAIGGPQGDRQVPEGAQNAFVNLYGRLAANCPVEQCDRSTACVLCVDGVPKAFDGADGKLRFLRMKVRTEGRRVHRRSGVDVLTSGQADLVGADDWRYGGAAAPDPVGSATDTVQRSASIDQALDGLAERVRRLDPAELRGGRENVALALTAVGVLIERTLTAPVPEAAQERRDAVHEVLLALSPQLAEGAPAAVRQRQKRVREVMRAALVAAGGPWLAEAWVPAETSKRRGLTQR